MLKICTNGHVTGYRNCPQCGSKSVEPLAPYRIVKREVKPIEELLERKVFVPAPPFKLWRKMHRVKRLRFKVKDGKSIRRLS